MGVDELVSQVGLWWPAADEDGVRDAAQAWARTAAALDHAVDVGCASTAQFSTRPAVPEYCRCTPADLSPLQHAEPHPPESGCSTRCPTRGGR